MRAWLTHHLHSLKIAAQRFFDAPVASLFTILVIGVAVAMPTGLYLLLSNLDRAAGDIKPQAEITVFLKTELGEAQGKALANTLASQADIASVRFVSKSEGIEKLESAGLSDIAAGLPDNPLPHALVVTPKDTTPPTLEALGSRLRQAPESERVLMDTDWIKRLAALMGLGRDLVFMLSIMLGLALAAITANTIRLQIYAQRDEIEVARLIGATDRFIRRPFLYFGGIQGLAGGLTGGALVGVGAHLLEASVERVASAYGAQFVLGGLSGVDLMLLLGLSATLGWLGAYFAVGQALRQVENT
jgi:cell division transport system permease protein